jgi:hypothetical protein
VKYLNMEFSFDELQAFRVAMDESALAGMLMKIDQRIRDDAKIMLQMTSKGIEELRVLQGVIQGMTMFEIMVKELMGFDVEALMKVEANVNEEEDEDATQPVMDF